LDKFLCLKWNKPINYEDNIEFRTAEESNSKLIWEKKWFGMYKKIIGLPQDGAVCMNCFRMIEQR